MIFADRAINSVLGQCHSSAASSVLFTKTVQRRGTTLAAKASSAFLSADCSPNTRRAVQTSVGDLISDVSFAGEKYETVSMDNGYKKYMMLKIRGVSRSDFVYYRCVAKNSLGETDGLIKLDGEYRGRLSLRERKSERASETGGKENSNGKVKEIFIRKVFLRKVRGGRSENSLEKQLANADA